MELFVYFALIPAIISLMEMAIERIYKFTAATNDLALG
jgi:hypothetical protein